MVMEAKFFVGDIPVYGDLILAPMAGFADPPHRAVCRSFGAVMNYTEFVAVEQILANDRRAWSPLDAGPEEKPLTLQIFGNDAGLILEAAQRLEQELEPDIIDINMGCSTRRVSGRGAGVGMMRRPELVAETFRLLTRHLSVPVTGKIRLGWQEQPNYLEIGQILQDNGCALVAIHPRTKEQKYGGRADWDAIAALKEALAIPVIGNGDIRTPADIERMKAYTGCDGVMIGRGAIGNPWLFAGRDRADLPPAALVEMTLCHLQKMIAYYGRPQGVILFRKYLKRYMQPLPAVQPILKRLLTSENDREIEDLLWEALALLDEPLDSFFKSGVGCKDQVVPANDRLSGL